MTCLPSLKCYEERHVALLLHRTEKQLKRLMRRKIAKSEFGKKYISIIYGFGIEQILIAPSCKLLELIRSVEDLYYEYGDVSLFEEINTELRDKVFDYDYFMRFRKTRGSWSGHELMRAIFKHVKYCPYCNADTIYAVEKDCDSIKLAKSAFDHFYPRWRYPFLGISLYNLIPACTRCNTSFKRDAYEGLCDMANPYDEDCLKSMAFNILPRRSEFFRTFLAKDLAGILFREKRVGDCRGGLLWDNMFGIERVYTAMFKQDAADIMLKATQFPASYLAMLKESLVKRGLDASIIDRIVYGSPIAEEEINLHRFGKMTFDLVCQYREFES